MGELELSAITSRDGMLVGLGSGKGSSAANQSFLNSNSLMDIVKMDNKSNKNLFNSFLEEDEMTFLQNMKDERESAVLTINESILQLDNEKNMDINQKRNYFKDLFLRESRLLLKLLVLVSENELQQQIKEMKLNKDLKITEAGTLSKKTQKQHIDIEEQKKKIVERPLAHNESEMYGLNIKQEYQSPLSWVPDFYKLSSVELYEARMKAKAKEQAQNNETIPIIIPKDDSDSTMIRIQNDLEPDILDRQPDFLKKQNVKFAPAEKNKNGIKPNDFFEENNKKVESLQQFMKQQQQMKFQQLEQQNNQSGEISNINNSNPKKTPREPAKNLLPMLYDAGSISSIHLDQIGSSKSKNNSVNFPHNPSAPSLLNNSRQDRYNNNNALSASSWGANEYSVLQKSGQNILGTIDDIYKNMYTKKLNLE